MARALAALEVEGRPAAVEASGGLLGAGDDVGPPAAAAAQEVGRGTVGPGWCQAASTRRRRTRPLPDVVMDPWLRCSPAERLQGANPR
jgi:hypothetical protein